jgi:glycosyltransferase involved in cell wall biosynthesis
VRIVFINRFYSPDVAATAQLLGDLATHLAARGHEVGVICSRLRLGDEHARLPYRERAGGVTIRRVWSTSLATSRGTSLARRALDYLSFYISASIALMRIKPKPDVVVACTDPPLFSVLAAAIAGLRGVRLVNWLHDLFPEVALRLGVLPPVAGTLLQRLRDWSLRRARCNVVLGEGMAQRVRALAGDASGVAVVHNWADAAQVYPVPRDENPLRRCRGLGETFVVMYSGNLGRAHALDGLLAAAERLRDRPDIVFQFVGGGAQLERLRAVARDRDLSGVRFEPAQPRRHLARLLSLADVHVVSLRPALEGLVVPSKFYGIAAAGRPCLVLGARDGEVARMVRELNCGVVLDADDGEAIAAAIVALHDDPSRCAEMGRRAREGLLDHYERGTAMRRWEEVLDGV